MKSLSCVRLFVTPWTVAYQAPPSMGFSRQEYWSGVPLSSPKASLLSLVLTKQRGCFKKKRETILALAVGTFLLAGLTRPLAGSGVKVQKVGIYTAL